MTTRALAVTLLCGLCSSAGADQYLLRMATIAPDGTSWAREIKAFGREVEEATNGEVRMKWYFGGIAGNDVNATERVRKSQLDGIGSGGMLCERLAPTFRALRLLGVYQSRDEVAYVARKLRPVFDQEYRAAGFTNMGEGVLGPIEVLSRHPLRSMSDLRKERIWVWDEDVVQRATLGAIGINLIPLPLEQATKAYADGRVDAFLSVPTASLAFQWSVQARYMHDLRVDYLVGCIIIANRAFDRLPLDHQAAVRAAAAKLHVRWEEVVRMQDEALLGGLFERQGLVQVPVSPAFRNEFFEQSRAASDKLDDKVVGKELIKKVVALVAEYRAQHPPPSAAKGDKR